MGGTRGRHTELVPAEPFVHWLHEQVAEIMRDETIVEYGPAFTRGHGYMQILSRRLGVTERAVYRYLRQFDGSNNPTDTFRRCRVEDMLEHAGHDLYDIYPDLRPDVELEPDTYCPKCSDNVTPISGHCPWCDTPTKHGTRSYPRSCRFTDRQLRQLHLLHRDHGATVRSLAEQLYDRYGFASPDSCGWAIRNAWRRMHLPVRDDRHTIKQRTAA